MRAALLLAALLLAAPARGEDDDAALTRQRNEGLVVRALKSIRDAQRLFQDLDKDDNGVRDFAPNLATLERCGLLVPKEAKAEQNGYRFALQRSKSEPERRWMAVATPLKPGVTGSRSFAISADGAVLHGLKPFALQDDCRPKGVKVEAPLAGWTPKATPLGALLQKVVRGPALISGAYLVSADKGTVLHSVVRVNQGLSVATLIAQRDGRATWLDCEVSPDGFLVRASLRRGRLRLRGRPEPAWTLTASTSGFALAKAGGPPTPLACSPRALPREVLIFGIPPLLLSNKAERFSAPLVTMGTLPRPSAPKGTATVLQTKTADGSVEFTFEHPTHPSGAVQFSPPARKRGLPRPKLLQGQIGPLTAVSRREAQVLLRSFLPKGLLKKTQVARALKELKAIKAGLDGYRRDMGRFPRAARRPASLQDAAVALVDDGPALYAGLLNEPTVGGGKRAPYIARFGGLGILKGRAVLAADKIGAGARRLTPRESNRERYRRAFQRLHGPKSERPLVLLDPWGNPYHYREWASVRTSIKDGMLKTPIERTVTVGGKAKIVKDHPHNPESFDIWSNGPNGINEYGAPGSDDVVSWRP